MLSGKFRCFPLRTLTSRLMCLSVCLSASHRGCRFGGGPAVNHLYVCSICQVEIEALAKRRRIEIDTFIKVRAGGGGAGHPWGPGDRMSQAVWKMCSVGGRTSQAFPG